MPPSQTISEKLEAYYGLPSEVVFCKRCVMSNQRPASYPEFKHTKDRKAPTMHIDADGICDACLLQVYEGRYRPPEKQSWYGAYLRDPTGNKIAIYHTS